ncbi:MAG: hypothetical protein AAFQ65_02710 [Myxococcota bacterium]
MQNVSCIIELAIRQAALREGEQLETFAGWKRLRRQLAVRFTCSEFGSGQIHSSS